MAASPEERFHAAMLGIYERARRLRPPYRASYFLHMVQRQGGKAAADQLLSTAEPSTGFTELFLRGSDNLKLSVEYLVLQEPWRGLFSAEQRAIARQRLRQVKCAPPPEDADSA